MEVHGDVQAALARGDDAADNEDLEEELRELMADDERAADGNEQDDDLIDRFKGLDINRLPSPPSTSPRSAETAISAQTESCAL